MKIFYFDMETTGVMHWKNGVHQISGAIEVDGVLMEEFNFNVQPNPLCIIDEVALSVSNVTKEKVLSYELMGKVYLDIIGILSKHVDKYNKADKFFLIGYNNASFDNAFLRAFFVQNGDNYFGSWFWSSTIDVMVLAAEHLKNERHKMVDFKLKTVAAYMGIPVDETKLHDALYDIELTRNIYKLISK